MVDRPKSASRSALTKALSDKDAQMRAVVWGHALAAMAIFGVAWRAHARVRPYAFAFQNQLEHGLFAANIVLVVLGTAYTSLVHYTDGTSHLFDRRERPHLVFVRSHCVSIDTPLAVIEQPVEAVCG